MRDGLWPALLIIGFVFVWVLAKVFAYAKKSEAQWQAVDKSKLRTWDDEEDD